MTRSRSRRGCAAVVAVVAAFALPAAAHASKTQESIIEDETQMLECGPEAQARALDDAKALGAETIRANVLWRRYAPAPDDFQRPVGFDAGNPAAYAPGTWDMLGAMIAGAEARGLSVILTVTGAGPAWASRCQGSVAKRRTCRPRPRMLGDFVRALATQFPQARRGPPGAAVVGRLCGRRGGAVPAGQGVVDLERAEPARLALAPVRTGSR